MKMGYWLKKLVLDITATNSKQKFSLNRIMIVVWFYYLVKLLNKAIETYGMVIVEKSIVSLIEPTFAVTVFLVLLSYEFGKKTQLNIKGHEVVIEKEEEK